MNISIVVVSFVFKHAVFSIFERTKVEMFFREHSNAVLNFKVFVGFSFLFF